jgi:hypothetical protein
MAANKRISELPLRNNPSLNMRVAAWNPSDDITYGVILSSVVGSSDSGVPVWDEETVFALNDVVVSDNNLWVSQQNNNQGVLPGIDTDFWVLANQGSNFTFWQPSVYTFIPTVVFNQLADGGIEIFMLSPDVDLPFISEDFSEELAAGTWIQITNNVTSVEVDTSGSTITLDALFKAKIDFTGSEAIAAAKTWVIDNYDFLKESRFDFTITNAESDIQTMPPGVKMIQDSGVFNPATGEWTPYSAGDYEAIIRYDGTNLKIRIEGPFSNPVSS